MSPFKYISYDLECPYCEAKLNVCHDDGFGYEEGMRHEMQCSECDKNFVFETSISFDYEPEKAECLNGQPHRPTDSRILNQGYPDYLKCQDCDYEFWGEYDKSKDIYRKGENE